MFTEFLFLLFLGATSSVIVPPPTNATVSCRNLETTVSWTYSDEQPQTRFHVNIRGSEGHHEDETSEHRYDLSRYVWQSHLHYMDFNYVTVTAIQGGERSQPVVAPSFTFNGLKKAHVTCALDFPPVNVAAEETVTAITFYNPFHFYTELKESERHPDAFFKFTVFSHQGEFTSVCTVTQLICRFELPSSDDVEECVTLKGWLDYGNNVEHVVFKETDRICATEPGAHVVVTVVLLAVFGLIVVAVTICICTVKPWTLNSVPKPSLPTLVPLREQDLRFYPVTREEIHPVTVHSRCPSVCMEDGDCQASGGGGVCGKEGSRNTSGGAAGSGSASGGSGSASCGVELRKSDYTDGRFLEDSNQDPESVVLMCTGHGTDEDSTDDSGRTECFFMEEAEPNLDPHPHYDRGHYDRKHTS